MGLSWDFTLIEAELHRDGCLWCGRGLEGGRVLASTCLSASELLAILIREDILSLCRSWEEMDGRGLGLWGS